VFAAYGFVLFVTKLSFAHVPLVLARYIIPAFPMGYILVALGMDSIWKTASIIPANKKITNTVFCSAAVCFLAGLAWTGPLRQTYVSPNNFTSHSTFQESYAPLSWDRPRISDMLQRPFDVNEENMSVFYKTLAGQANVKKIIEYPMLLGNHYNLFYYYQRFHKKNVTVGYTRSIKNLPDGSTGYVSGNMLADHVLSQVKNPDQLKFQNMVDLRNITAVKNSRADLAVFHKNPFFEMFKPKTGNDGSEMSMISDLSLVYRKYFGHPVFEDRHLIVYKIRD